MVNVTCPRCAAPLAVMWVSPFISMLDSPRIVSASDPDHAATCGVMVVYKVLAQIDECVRRNESASAHLVERLVINRPTSWGEAAELASDLDEVNKGLLQ